MFNLTSLNLPISFSLCYIVTDYRIWYHIVATWLEILTEIDINTQPVCCASFKEEVSTISKTCGCRGGEGGGYRAAPALIAPQSAPWIIQETRLVYYHKLAMVILQGTPLPHSFKHLEIPLAFLDSKVKEVFSCILSGNSVLQSHPPLTMNFETLVKTRNMRYLTKHLLSHQTI